VDILDPATGTGTFICELLEHFRGQPKKLEYKYKNELHANEVAILPYYVANLNIEATFAAITGEYAEFPNLCFVDTLDNVGLHTAQRGSVQDLFGSVSEENVARIKRQNSRRISVVIGNPPYNANQANENDNNKNREYPDIDRRIKATYIAESTAQKTKLYDMYARFFRWASDRLDANGVLAFVTNRSFIESRTFDGFRKTVAAEFADIYVVDLGGDVRANPKLSGTKHNVFGIQTGVAISFMVKKVSGTKDKRAARVHYVRRPEMETAEEKLGFLANHAMSGLAFDEVQPDKTHNWVNLTSNDFETLIPLASKDTKAAKSAGKERAIFKLFSLGISTNRDEWVTDADKAVLERKAIYLSARLTTDIKQNAIKWSRNLKRRVQQGRLEEFDRTQIRPMYRRPFLLEWMYDSSILLDERGAAPDVFPLGTGVPYIAIHCISSHNELCALAHTEVPDLNLLKRGNGGTYYLPISVGATKTTRADNITDWALKQFTTHYADEIGKGNSARKITKQAIFHYCYAVLHDPLYREKYAQNLKREFPRIPFYSGFWQWAAWGEQLMALHIGYEAVQPFALSRTDLPDAKARAAGMQPKALLRADPAAGSITLDTETTLRGIPPAAWTYKLGNRCAIDWVLDQYKEKKPKDPTIREKFDTYRFADYKEKVIDLLMRVTTVSLETVRVVEAMKAINR
jgi:predicted helicase